MISLILIFIAALFNAIMDVLDFKFSTSIFSLCKKSSWVNPAISWKNKWKNGDPAQGEKFFGSSTFLVFITDLWHFSKFVMLLLMMGSIVFYKPIFNSYVDLLILYCVFTITFEIMYSKILIKK